MHYRATFSDGNGHSFARVFAAADAGAAAQAARAWAGVQARSATIGSLALPVTPMCLGLQDIAAEPGPWPAMFCSWAGVITRGGHPGGPRHHTARRVWFAVHWSNGKVHSTDRKTYRALKALWSTLEPAPLVAETA